MYLLIPNEEVLIVICLAKLRIEDGLHLLLRHTWAALCQFHEVVVAPHYILVERHLADVHLMLQMTIQQGCLLKMYRHGLVLVALCILEEEAPEGGNVLLPQGTIDSLFLIEAVIAGLFQEFRHQEALGRHVHTTHAVLSG